MRRLLATAYLRDVAATESGGADEVGERNRLNRREDLLLKEVGVGAFLTVCGLPLAELSLLSSDRFPAALASFPTMRGIDADVALLRERSQPASTNASYRSRW
jgi:hypothetical protein